MARLKIEWTQEARNDLLSILEFYVWRNGSPVYSKKLYNRINKSVSLLAGNPLLGRKTSDHAVRILITGDYEIIYEIFDRFILIIMVWDVRRDPDDRQFEQRKKSE